MKEELTPEAQKVIDKENLRLEREAKGEVWKQDQIIEGRFYRFSNDAGSFTAEVRKALKKGQTSVQMLRNGRAAEITEINWRDYEVRECSREQAHEWSVG